MGIVWATILPSGHTGPNVCSHQTKCYKLFFCKIYIVSLKRPKRGRGWPNFRHLPKIDKWLSTTSWLRCIQCDQIGQLLGKFLMTNFIAKVAQFRGTFCARYCRQYHNLGKNYCVYFRQLWKKLATFCFNIWSLCLHGSCEAEGVRTSDKTTKSWLNIF